MYIFRVVGFVGVLPANLFNPLCNLHPRNKKKVERIEVDFARILVTFNLPPVVDG